MASREFFNMSGRIGAIFGVILAIASLGAADISKQQADLFSRKVAQIVQADVSRSRAPDARPSRRPS